MSTSDARTAHIGSACRIYLWPLAEGGPEGVVTHDDPDCTVITSFRLKGDNTQQQLDEMKAWIEERKGFDIQPLSNGIRVDHVAAPGKTWEQAAKTSDFRHPEVAIVGYSFTVPAANGYAWRETFRDE
jgi:hypothetical protein